MAVQKSLEPYWMHHIDIPFKFFTKNFDIHCHIFNVLGDEKYFITKNKIKKIINFKDLLNIKKNKKETSNKILAIPALKKKRTV